MEREVELPHDVTSKSLHDELPGALAGYLFFPMNISHTLGHTCETLVLKEICSNSIRALYC